APFAGQDKIFIERTLQRSRIGNAQHRVGPLNVVSGSETRLGLTRNDQAVVQIAANSQVERPVSLGDRILQVKGQLFYIRMTAKWIQGTAGTRTEIVGRRSRPGQVVTTQQRNEGSGSKRVVNCIGLQARPVALRWIVEPRVANKYRSAAGIQTRRIQRRIDDPEIEILGKKRLLIRSSQLKVIDPLHVGNI